jgi:hypothetical protein
MPHNLVGISWETRTKGRDGDSQSVDLRSVSCGDRVSACCSGSDEPLVGRKRACTSTLTLGLVRGAPSAELSREPTCYLPLGVCTGRDLNHHLVSSDLRAPVMKGEAINPTLELWSSPAVSKI